MKTGKIKTAHCAMTGGHNYTYWGELENGTFYASNGTDNFTLYNADYGVTMTEEFLTKNDGDSYLWERRHQIDQTLSSIEVRNNMKEVFKVLKDTALKAGETDKAAQIDKLAMATVSGNLIDE